MIDNFAYAQPVKIYFGCGQLSKLSEILEENGCEKCVIVSSKFFTPLCEKIKNGCNKIAAVYNAVQPNPLLSGTQEVLDLIKAHSADTVIALGGGSAIDTAKFAAACAYGSDDAYTQYTKQDFPEKTAKIVAIPTTSGTGSEVTKVSVISHKNEKKSIHNPSFMPNVAIVDPELTLSVPAKTTMITGIDAFTHAIEAYWSVNHQPITDTFAKESIKLILDNLDKSYECGDIESRTNMAYASLLAGLAFSVPKTAASHACSFSLSAYYHLPHGEACAFTLDSLIKLNADDRLEKLAKDVGLKDTDELAEKVKHFKKLAGLAEKLSDLGENVDVDLLAEEGANHPLMANNPVKLTADDLKKMYLSLK